MDFYFDHISNRRQQRNIVLCCTTSSPSWITSPLPLRLSPFHLISPSFLYQLYHHHHHHHHHHYHHHYNYHHHHLNHLHLHHQCLVNTVSSHSYLSFPGQTSCQSQTSTLLINPTYHNLGWTGFCMFSTQGPKFGVTKIYDYSQGVVQDSLRL